MSQSLSPVAVSRADRILAVVDLVRHPHLTRELFAATDGFRARGTTRAYPNDNAGRRREAREIAILWHRGYRPPPALIHNAMWWTGGPSIAIPFAREVERAPMTERQRQHLERIGLGRG